MLKVNGTFSPEKSFDCGQCFRFSADAGGRITGVAGARFFSGKMQDGAMNVDCTDADAAFWSRYLDLDADYSAYEREIIGENDTVLKNAAAAASGIRIFRQEPFETLLSFIISQNNNIPRIRGIIERLCESFGEKKICSGGEYYAFPTPERLRGAEAEDLACLRAGFRAKYLADAVKKWNGGEIDVDFLCKSSYNEASEILKRINGVGDKVAACVLLFSAHRLDAFPVDVWIKRTMQRFYGDLDSSRFGAYPGLAQQYLFYYSRYIDAGKE